MAVKRATQERNFPAGAILQAGCCYGQDNFRLTLKAFRWLTAHTPAIVYLKMARLVAISSSACGLDAPEPEIQPVFFILLRHYFMTRSKTAASSTGQSRPAIIVRHSPVHGNGVFA